DQHIEAIINSPIFSESDTIAKLKDRKLKIVVDAVNASGSIVVPTLLRKLGCEVIELFCDASGIFPHTPEPLPINLTELAAAVKEHKADLGIAVDPDADRLVLIDENGVPIGEELTITLAAEAALSSKDALGKYDAVVTVNYSTTRTVEDIAAKYGAVVKRSAVGEINVVRKMKEVNALVGGEGSGGVILPACHYGRDSLVGCALILHLLAQRDSSLSEICADLPKYAMLKLKRQFSGQLDELIDQVIEAFPDGKATRDDGIKIDFEKSWVQLRASNTEPIVRIIAEAPTKKEAKELAEVVIKIVTA
ncbi:MAG: phosphoglucosamine mutase, partial [Chlorobi bacterium]|nr:phosphoglucosamine mutase [Chlorobiota bacterium]